MKGILPGDIIFFTRSGSDLVLGYESIVPGHGTSWTGDATTPVTRHNGPQIVIADMWPMLLLLGDDVISWVHGSQVQGPERVELGVEVL